MRRLEHLLEKQNKQIEELQFLLKERDKPSNTSVAVDKGATCLLPPAPGPCTTLSLQRPAPEPATIGSCLSEDIVTGIVGHMSAKSAKPAKFFI